MLKRAAWASMFVLGACSNEPVLADRDANLPDSGPPPVDAARADAGVDAGIADAGFDVDAWVPSCGDGVVSEPEGCDDGNDVAYDGCFHCLIEVGKLDSWICEGSPSVCRLACGDGQFLGPPAEYCDDGNLDPGDGCDGRCNPEQDFQCAGPLFGVTTCTTTCGDAIRATSRVSTEQCDDGNTAGGDGCSATCTIEPGYYCDEPFYESHCAPRCGDRMIAGAEECDDGNVIDGDGCSSVCRHELGCHNPSECVCGDAHITSLEQCDDGNTNAGDGCSPVCVVEVGWECLHEPSYCLTACGDGVLAGTELCDDGNSTSGDGCSAFCLTELSSCEACLAYNCIPSVDCDGMVSAPMTSGAAVGFENRELCGQLMRCYLGSDCIGSYEYFDCYDSPFDVSAFYSTTPNGPCASLYDAAAGSTAGGGETLRLRSVDMDWPSGGADNQIDCMLSFCSSECCPFYGLDAAPGGGACTPRP